MGIYVETKRLNIKTRNKVRALISLPTNDAIKGLNDIRKRSSAGELAQIERVLLAYSNVNVLTIPSHFPTLPQTSEGFFRLDPIPLHEQIQLIENHSRVHRKTLLEYIEETRDLNKYIVNKHFEKAAKKVGDIYQKFGYTHHLARKAVLIRVLAPSEISFAEIEDFLVACGSAKNNIIITSLMHCYKEEQDFLSTKRSIMNIPDRGSSNRFTRDISRIAFHPICRSSDDLRDHLQSAMQSSLFDAVLMAKINTQTVRAKSFAPTLMELWESLDKNASSIDDIASLYDTSDSDCEHQFYKHSSAWLETQEISAYRRFLDHFYDAPDSIYISLTPDLIEEVSPWTGIIHLNDLSTSRKLTNHSHSKLQELEANGTVTRSALFNFCLHTTRGCTSITEENLVELMGMTRDLNKTISVEFAGNLAKSCDSKISKLLLYLLIAKKSRNEKDDHLLRKVLQEIAIHQFGGDLVRLLNNLYERCPDIGHYAYEVFTEDFIAKLFKLTSSTTQITETRASIHKWMGQITGEKVYVDRARTLLIDHQINKVRNELDDNRIYVDVARFQEWFDDEMLGEMNAALSALEHKNYDLDNGLDSVLLILIERCYATFCSNKVFGIASYLGRRIRHGTFKGHLYPNVIAIARTTKFSNFINNPNVGYLWDEWKSNYEAKIDEIIRERLHVASSSKRHGLLNPNLNHPLKQGILQAGERNLHREFAEAKSSISAKQIVTEYCWRLAEVDLKIFGAYLKNQRKSLVNQELLTLLKGAAPLEKFHVAAEFVREITRAIDESLMTMQTWFKKPLNVAPKASLPLLYRAVAEEVRQTFSDINVHTDTPAEQDIELMGGAYHVLYDAFYVVVYNAAKHGKPGGLIFPDFKLEFDESQKKRSVVICISSELREDEIQNEVCERLKVGTEEEIEDAQLYENRSGIPKLYQLQMVDPKFSIIGIECADRHVSISFSYFLEH